MKFLVCLMILVGASSAFAQKRIPVDKNIFNPKPEGMLAAVCLKRGGTIVQGEGPANRKWCARKMLGETIYNLID